MFKKLFSKKVKKLTQDKPQGFGYKNKWLVVKSNDNEKVAKFLEFKNIEKSNWTDGLKFGYEKGIFITPTIRGWILVLGIDISDLETESSKELLRRVSQEFGECQIFLTQRIIEYHFWGLARNGEIERLYSYVGETDENMIIEGAPTEVEKKCNLVNFSSEKAKNDEYWEREDIEFPNEETVMQIAENWSVNPTKIGEYDDIKGFGLICK